MAWNIQMPTAEYYTPSDRGIERLINEVAAQKEIAIDTETDGLVLWKCIPYYWSLSWTDEGRDKRAVLPASTMPMFKDSFRDKEKNWVFANAKFDVHMMANLGIDIEGRLVDTQVMHSLLYEEESHALKYMARKILGWKWTDFGDTFGSMRKGVCVCQHSMGAHKKGEDDSRGFCKNCACSSFRQSGPLDLLRKAEKENMSLLVEYAANDAYGTWKVYLELRKQMQATETHSLYPYQWPYIRTLWDLFDKIEVPFTRALYTCERNGLRVNRQYLEDIAPTIQKDIDKTETRITQLAGFRLNTDSPPQLREYFIDTLGYKPRSWTKGGKSGKKLPQIDEKFLQYYADQGSEVCELILEKRLLSKQLNTYIQKMPGLLDPADRVHMRLNQAVAKTGRLSSSEPNMQNVTTGEKDRFKLREAFIPKPGNTMIVADYKQLEMRLLAAAAMEPKMIDIFLQNWDIHMGNASMVFGLPYEDLVQAKSVDKAVKSGEMDASELTPYLHECLAARAAAKTIGFGLNYGMKEWTLARRMGCHVDEAKEKIAQYMATYPAVAQFYDESIQEAVDTGYAYTLLGRRRHLPEIYNSRDDIRWRAERQASNLPIQGTAADVCKMAMIRIQEDKLDEKYGYQMCLQVHDEIVGECPTETLPEVTPLIKEWMEHSLPTDLAVPLEVDLGTGPSWGAAK